MNTYKSKNAWLFHTRYARNELTSKSAAALREMPRFGSKRIYGLRPDGSKIEEDFIVFRDNAPSTELEHYLGQAESYVNMADECQWAPATRFANYGKLLDGPAKNTWRKLMDEGHDYWDNNNQATDQDVVDALGAYFIMWTKHPNPGDAFDQHILRIQYKHQKEFNLPVKPSNFVDRMSELWRYSEMMPRIGAQCSDMQKTTALMLGLPEEAKDFLQDEKDVDVYDLQGNGNNALVWTDVMENLEAWWSRDYGKEVRKKYQQQEEKKRKRKDDDDDDEADGDGGQDRRQRKKKKNNRNKSGRNGNGNNSNNTNNGKEFHSKQCSIHPDHNHKWKDCIYCFNGSNFKKELAEKFYQGKTRTSAPYWWKKGYERRFKSNEQEPPQQQHGSYLVAPQQPAQLPPAPVPQAPPQPAPMFATSAATAPSAPVQQQLYSIQVNAQGQRVFVPHQA